MIDRLAGHRAPFACAAHSFAHVPLGSHDGVESWTLQIGEEASSTEQLLVSLHERRHHELQTTSPWGFLMTVAATVAADELLFAQMARGCKQVHETFATYFSVGTDLDFLHLLEGNREYLSYLRRGRALEGARTADGARRFVDAVLRLAMAPAAVRELDLGAIASLSPSSIRNSWTPDQRLQEIEKCAGDIAVQLDRPPLDHAGLVATRDVLAKELNGRGIATMSFLEHADWIRSIVSEVEHSPYAGQLRFQIVIGPTADSVEADVDEMQRERLALHVAGRLPLEIVPTGDLRARARDFARSHAEYGVHSWMVWIRRDLLARQFEIEDGLLPVADDELVLGLLSCDRVHGVPVARLCWFDAMPPAIVFAAIAGKAKILFCTTLASIVDTPAEAELHGVAPVFALIDQPLVAFCQHTLDGGAELRWRVFRIEGDRLLSVFVFENGEIPDVFYLTFASAGMRPHLLRWLESLAPNGCVYSAELAEAHGAALAALSEHLVGTFWLVDYFGGRRDQ